MKKTEPLQDVCFVYVTRLDSIERLENTILSTSYILNHLNAKIFVFEYGSYYSGILKLVLPQTINYKFFEDNDPVFFRTKYINNAISQLDYNYIAVWDADVIAPYQQVLDSIELLRQNDCDFVYPYEHKFLDTSSILRKLYIEENNIDIFCKIKIK